MYIYYTYFVFTPSFFINFVDYSMAGNISREFNLVVWQMSGLSAKFKSSKYSANVDFTDLHIYATVAVPGPAHAEIAAEIFN